MTTFVTKAKLRKATNSHSIPMEILRAILKPKWIWKQKIKAGVGTPTLAQQLPILTNTHDRLRLTQQQIRRQQATPTSWHWSETFAINKGTAGPAASPKHKRLLHNFCSYAKLFYKSMSGVWHAHQPPTYMHQVHGCIPHRRREAPVRIQNIGCWRAKALGLQSVLVLYDQTNALWNSTT